MEKLTNDEIAKLLNLVRTRAGYILTSGWASPEYAAVYVSLAKKLEAMLQQGRVSPKTPKD